jgi:hypothetical protein
MISTYHALPAPTDKNVLKRRILWNYERMEMKGNNFFSMICLATCFCCKPINLKVTFTGLHRSLAKQDDFRKLTF